MIDLLLPVPGRFLLIDHAMTRMERGLAGALIVEGPEAPEIFHAGSTSESGHSGAKAVKP